MTAAWQFAFESRMGLFSTEKDEEASVSSSSTDTTGSCSSNPLAVSEDSVLRPVAPTVEPHDLWIRFLIERIEIAKHCSQDQVELFAQVILYFISNFFLFCKVYSLIFNFRCLMSLFLSMSEAGLLVCLVTLVPLEPGSGFSTVH